MNQDRIFYPVLILRLKAAPFLKTHQKIAKIHVFDRYSKLLKQLGPNGKGWDGTFNGAKMPSSDYWFTVTYIDHKDGKSKQFKSHFTLKR